jgi:enoyl-CoA hydratase/carnithine racemase
VADLLDIRVPSGVASVIFSRPPANALDADAMQQFTPRFCELAERDGVRVVVLAGDGRTFCAGVDRGGFDAPWSEVGDRARFRSIHRAFLAAIREFSKSLAFFGTKQIFPDSR